jgi:hypothetical protein
MPYRHCVVAHSIRSPGTFPTLPPCRDGLLESSSERRDWKALERTRPHSRPLSITGTRGWDSWGGLTMVAIVDSTWNFAVSRHKASSTPSESVKEWSDPSSLSESHSITGKPRVLRSCSTGRSDPNILLPIPTLLEGERKCAFAFTDSVHDRLLNRSTASVAERLQKLFSSLFLLFMVFLLFLSFFPTRCSKIMMRRRWIHCISRCTKPFASVTLRDSAVEQRILWKRSITW